MLKWFIPFALLLSSITYAQSYDYTKKFGLGGSVGYNGPLFGNMFNTEANEGESFGIHGRYHLNKFYALEAAFAKHEFNKTTKALNVYDVTMFRRLLPLSRFTPIVGFGAGVVDIPNYGEDNLKLGLKLRGGIEYALTQALSLGLYADYQHVNKMFFQKNLDQHNIHVLAARVGLTWYFGQCAKSTEASKSTTPVSSTKAAKDADKDGVIDSEDKCPNTAQGVEVNAYGCAEEEKAEVKLEVQFDSGKTTINKKYHDALKKVADFMSKHTSTSVEIQGHTDSSGNKNSNKDLSQKRADAVKDYLVKEFKVDEERLTAKGFGDEQPIADNKTFAGKQANRRVMAIINE